MKYSFSYPYLKKVFSPRKRGSFIRLDSRLRGKSRFIVLIFIFLFFFFSSSYVSFAQNTHVPVTAPVVPPVVVELFTSEKCGFCPPADMLLGQLSRQSGIIALSCHVDYFPGTSSPLAKQFCSTRQQSYINAMRDVKNRFTPHMVINGHMSAIGYETDKVNASLFRARAEKIGHIRTRQKSADRYDMILPDLRRNASVELVLISYRKPEILTMRTGRNAGQPVTYTHIIHSMHSIGAWDGTAQLRHLNTRAAPNIEGFAVLAQERGTGRIVAAGHVSLN